MDSTSIIRLAAFVSLLIFFAIFEHFRPRRVRTESRAKRWPGNILVLLIGNILVRIMGPLIPFSVAVQAEIWGFGLANWLALPFGLEAILAVLILDLAIYGQHVLFHYVPLFWRLHRMHHSDTDFDVTTALRFHPIEILLSALFKSFLVLILGLNPWSIFIFEVLLNGSAMFNHSNWKLPISLDKVLRRALVTPDMHRVHHSQKFKENNSNFGFFFSFWDYLFRTYTAQPELGHDEMKIGLKDHQYKNMHRVDQLILDPFRPEKKEKKSS